MKGIKVQALVGAGEHIADPLPGAGQANPYCASEPQAPSDATENARSLGVLVTYGAFRLLDLGDLTKAKEIELACPRNLVGPVDLYVVTHHGTEGSNARAIVWAVRPRVAVMDNGAKKGADPAAWQIVHDSPGLEDLWQLHYAVGADPGHNVPRERIANAEENCQGKYIKASILPDGSFTVMNSANDFRKSYARK
jgi:hypothetical protein